MTLNFFSPPKQEYRGEKRYYVLKFDSDTYQIIDSIEDREICVCSNYDNGKDAEERAQTIATLLNENNEKTLG